MNMVSNGTHKVDAKIIPSSLTVGSKLADMS